jgi:hypothetical protein
MENLNHIPVDILNFDLAFWETFRLAFQSKLFFFLFLKRKILISSNYPFTSFSEVAFGPNRILPAGYLERFLKIVAHSTVVITHLKKTKRPILSIINS